MTVVQSSRCSREFTRLKRADREQAIKDAVAGGEHNPKAIAEKLGCTKELVLYYARRMPEIATTQHRPGPKLRRRVFLTWAG